MANSTGENEMGLKAILDFLRFGSIILLLLHFYDFCFDAFVIKGWRSEITDRFLMQVAKTGLFKGSNAKLFSLGMLVLSQLGSNGRKEEKIRGRQVLYYLSIGLLMYFFSSMAELIFPQDVMTGSILYITITAVGYLLILLGCAQLTRMVKIRLGEDVFNELNETFPQEERRLDNEFSINLPARYQLKGNERNSWINIINPFRGLLVSGSPGSGKSWFVIQHVIRQHLQKGFTMMVYDFKYDDLSKIVYNNHLENLQAFKVKPKFYLINFDDLSRSHCCNPLDSSSMFDITDATESSRSILLGLNREWITKQGDFFVESPINFLTAIIWFLKKYKNGKYCTLPHAIELMQVEYEKLFPVLRTEKEIEVLINPFISAYQNNAMEQLEGQIASAKIGMSRLSSAQLYWVLSKNDFTLDINNPEAPKILCLANNPQKQQVFGAVLSLYINRLIKLVNRKNQLKCSLVFDEFPTVFLNGVDNLIATARSNKVATCLGIQDFSQLKKDYGNDEAAVIMNIIGNVISGQVTGDTAKFLAERFGKIVQLKESISINSHDTSISRSGQLDYAIPASKIASLSSGEFVGMVADDPDRKIKLKTFHCEIVNDSVALNQQQKRYTPLPVVSQVTPEMVTGNYFRIRQEVADLIDGEIEILLNNDVDAH